MNKYLKCLFLIAFLCQPSFLYAMESPRYQIVTQGVTSALVGPIINKEPYPFFRQSSFVKVNELGSDVYFHQVEEFLFNELLETYPARLNANWVHGTRGSDNDHQFGGLVDSRFLHNAGPYHELIFTHIVTEPLTQMKIGNETMELSMGTCFAVGGEIDGRYGIQLASGQTGWIAQKDVQPLVELEFLKEHVRRDRILSQARKLVGQPYKWGGRSAFLEHGYDCSGFLLTVFLTSGKKLPHPVEWQRQVARHIRWSELKPGDVFFTMLNNSRAVHVVIWAGNNTVIEASPESMTVREASVETVFGKSFDEIKNGEIFYTDTHGKYSVRCGRLL